MFNLELPWRVAKGAVSATTHCIRFGAMDATEPSKFKGFGAMDVTKHYKVIVTCKLVEPQINGRSVKIESNLTSFVESARISVATAPGAA